jgi:hypothetical protein
MPATRIAIALALLAAAALPAAAEDPPDGLVIEGVAEPAVAARFAADARKADELIRGNAYTNALHHLTAFTRGVPFTFDFTRTDQPVIHFGRLPFQPAGGLVPAARQYRMLDSGLLLATIRYRQEDVARLGLLAEGRDRLSVYTTIGAYHNPAIPMRRTAMHWLAARDAYLNAVMQHLAAQGDRAILRVTGRAYPVRFLAADVLSVDRGAPPAESAPPAPGASPPGREREPPAPPADAPDPVAPPRDDAAPAQDPAPTDDAAPAESPDPAPAAQAPDAAPQPWDSRRHVYRLKMSVRVEIDDVVYADAPAPAAPPSQP